MAVKQRKSEEEVLRRGGLPPRPPSLSPLILSLGEKAHLMERESQSARERASGEFKENGFAHGHFTAKFI